MSESIRFTIAVVDDEPRTLESLANLLEAEGYDVRLYSSAEMIWTHGGLAGIDCLISDIGMPNVNGIELRRRALSERPELPVILITGRPELRAQYSSIIERDRYFEKPFDGQQLLAAIRAALSPLTSNRPEPEEQG